MIVAADPPATRADAHELVVRLKDLHRVARCEVDLRGHRLRRVSEPVALRTQETVSGGSELPTTASRPALT